jgi:hypothetical protein
MGGHALPVHGIVLLLQRLVRIRCAIRVADDPEGAARGGANRRAFAGVACGRADPGTQPRSERCTSSAPPTVWLLAAATAGDICAAAYCWQAA